MSDTEPVDLNPAYMPPWGNPGYIINVSKPRVHCGDCGYSYRGDTGCPLCGGEEAA